MSRYRYPQLQVCKNYFIKNYANLANAKHLSHSKFLFKRQMKRPKMAFAISTLRGTSPGYKVILREKRVDALIVVNCKNPH